MLGMQLVDLQLPNRITTTDFGLQFLPSKCEQFQWKHWCEC